MAVEHFGLFTRDFGSAPRQPARFPRPGSTVHSSLETCRSATRKHSTWRSKTTVRAHHKTPTGRCSRLGVPSRLCGDVSGCLFPAKPARRMPKSTTPYHQARQVLIRRSAGPLEDFNYWLSDGPRTSGRALVTGHRSERANLEQRERFWQVSPN